MDGAVTDTDPTEAPGGPGASSRRARSSVASGDHTRDPTLDDPVVEGFGMVLEAHNELYDAVARRLEATGVRVPWMGVLIRLARTPGYRLRMTDLARSMTMSTSGLTRLVDRVEETGHIRRESCPDDGRGTWAVLTDDGLALVERVAPRHVEDLHELLRNAVGDDRLVELTDLLRTVRDHVRQLGQA